MNLTRITHYCGLENKSRFLLNMKISALLSIVMIFSSFANSYSQVEISIDVKNQPIIKVLDEIESETDLRFIFGSEIYDFQKLISLSVNKAKLNDVIKLIFENRLSYDLNENVVLLKKSSEQQAIINTVQTKSDVIITKTNEEDIIQIIAEGIVTDSRGNPLPGATVIEVGTDNGTTSDFDGKFSIVTTNENPTLKISFIGFLSQEISVEGDSEINIVLVADVSGLDDVVVVGFGTQNRRDVTSAISKIVVDDSSPKSTANIQSLIYGRSAGIQITSQSGEPGAPAEVRIRGIGTTGNSKPLWIIDGLPINVQQAGFSTTGYSPLSGINPSDIKSIEVLKDASSAAIYGARASNGVIIVTTKRGGNTGKTEVNYESSFGFQTLTNYYDVLNTSQYIALSQELGNDYSQFSNNPTYDGQRLFANDNAPIENHNLSITGGNENANYGIMANYFRQESAQNTQSEFERFSFRVNSDIKVNDKLKFGESLSLAFMNKENLFEARTFLNRLGANAPFVNYFDPNGPGGFGVINNDTTGGAPFRNYFGVNDQRNSTLRQPFQRINGNFYGEYEILKGLKFRSSVGIDYVATQTYEESNESGGWDLSSYDAVTSNFFVTGVRVLEQTINFNNVLTYDTSFGKHNLKLLAGHEESSYNYDFINWRGGPIVNPNVRIAATGDNISVNDDKDHWAIRGFLGRVNYNFDQKYYLTVNVREDSSSRFQEGNRSQIFPSFSTAWRISDESFMDNANFIDDLKLRASYGEVGNQLTGINFAYIPSLRSTEFYTLGTNQDLVRAPAAYNYANPALSWETSVQMDIGLDVVLFEGAINATFDYYQKTTKDLLVAVPVPGTSGFYPNTDANVGSVENNGLEFSVGYNKTVNSDFNFSVNANLTTVNNQVIDLGGSEIITGIDLQSHRTAEGFEIGHFYGLQTDGLFQTQADIDSHATQTGAAPGDIKFKDLSGPNGVPDGVIDDLDRTYLGSPVPEFFYGFSLNANYRKFDFSIIGQGTSGNEIFNNARLTLEDYTNSTESGDNQSISVLNRWTGPGSSNEIPRAIVNGGPNANNRMSDRWIEDGSFLRIRNIQLGYSIPQDAFSSIKANMIKKGRVYVNAQNMFTFTNYSGLDPEATRGFTFSRGETPLISGQDDGRTPTPVTIQMGIQLTF